MSFQLTQYLSPALDIELPVIKSFIIVSLTSLNNCLLENCRTAVLPDFRHPQLIPEPDEDAQHQTKQCPASYQQTLR